MAGAGTLCPVCSTCIHSSDINAHLDRCLLRADARPKKARLDKSACVLTRSAASKSQALSQSTMTSSTCQTRLPCLTPCSSTSTSTSTTTTTTQIPSSSTRNQSCPSAASPSESSEPPLSQSPAPSGIAHQSPSPARPSSQTCPTISASPSSLATTSRSKIDNTKKAGISRDRTLLSMFQSTKEHSQVPGGEENVDTDGVLSPNGSTLVTSASVNSNVSVSGPKNARMDFKPLAERLRPETLDDVIGQDKAFGANTLLRTLIEGNEIPSIVFWGPPGCGKTSLAHVIANLCRRRGNTRFVTHSATSATTANIREVIRQAQNEQRLCQRKTILFIDEIHRFNKSQQVVIVLAHHCIVRTSVFTKV
uniref:AAA+ ATPase domain-containing protein n=1 Tax=Eptatretus burgeri TaxID=7764 RepID=A0A8C4QWR1_EPTBU